MPENEPLALVSTKVLLPSTTEPLPDSDLMIAELALARSSVPYTMTELDWETEPLPVKCSVSLETTTEPVRVLTPVSVSSPLARVKLPLPEMTPEKVVLVSYVVVLVES